MKNKFAVLIFFISAALFATEENFFSLNSRMNREFENGNFPKAVEIADEILKIKNLPVLREHILLVKGESLFRMGLFDSAEKTLSLWNKSLGRTVDAKSLFFLARCRFEKSMYESALSDFLNCASLFRESEWENRDYFFPYSVYYAGLCAEKCGKFELACSSFEYTVNEKNFFALPELETASLKLLQCLLQTGETVKCEKYGEYFVKQKFSPEIHSKISLCYAEALEKNGKITESHSLYCSLAENAVPSVRTLAMKKAYVLSSAYQDKILEKPVELLEKVKGSGVFQPDFLEELYVRLGIDSFNEKNFMEAKEFFCESQRFDAKNYMVLAELYIQECDFIIEGKTVNAALKAFSNLSAFSERKNIHTENPMYFNLQEKLCRYSCLSGNWEDSLERASLCLKNNIPAKIKDNFLYWGAVSSFNLGKIDETRSFLEKISTDDSDFTALRAKLFGKEEKYTKSAEEFSKIYNNKTEEDILLDYGRTLLNAEMYLQALSVLKDFTKGEGSYLKALAYFNMQNWENAEKLFLLFLSESQETEKKFIDYGKFYAGYSQYQQEKYAQALSSFKDFLESDSISALTWDACIAASRCAVALNKKDEAFGFAEKALSSSKNNGQKRQSVILYAGILSDFEEYDKALQVLKPYREIRDDFGFQCLYISAGILVQKKDYEGACILYEKLSEEKTAGKLAEEASYRSGELYFENGFYAEAASKFEKYIKKYPAGLFYDDSVYRLGESWKFLGSKDKAIFYFQIAAQKNRKSPYRYASSRNLIELYRSIQDYEKAVLTAETVLKDFKEEAEKDGIPLVIAELNGIKNGGKGELSLLEEKFALNGGENSFEGRITGTQLASLYKQNGFSEKAMETALKILEKQEKIDEEVSFAGKNALLAAEIYRENGNNLQASSYFLKASKFFRQSGEDEQAQRTLYGAAESFDAAGLKKDAASSAELLKELYPNSKYAEDAEVFIK